MSSSPDSAARGATAPGEERVSPLIHFFPSLTDVVFLLPFALVLKNSEGFGSLMIDSDTGWHVKTGEWIMQHGQVPHVDPFTFTRAGHAWFAWEWLWDLVFGWLHLHAGLAGVALVSLTTVAFAFAIAYQTTLRRSRNVFLVFALFLMGMSVSTVHWLARPHLLTLLFTALFCAVIDRARDHRPRLLWLLPLLTIFWANIHGAFIVGPILLFGWTAGEFFGWAVEADRGRARECLRRGVPYLLAGVGCWVASIVNPYGIQLHMHMFRFLAHGDPTRQIQEYQSMGFHGLGGMLFAALLLLAAATAVWHFVHKQFGAAFVTLGWAWLAMYAVRNLPIFVLVLLPLAAEAIQQMLDRADFSKVSNAVGASVRGFLGVESEYAAMDRHWRLHLVSAAGLGVIFMIGLSDNPPPKFKVEFDAKYFPQRAVDQVLSKLDSPRIFAHDQWGGYLLYRLYPRVPNFTDGRADLFGPDFMDEWEGIRSAYWDWQQRLDKYAIDTVVVPVTTPLPSTLKETKRWRVVYDDGMAIVFRDTWRTGGAVHAADVPGAAANGVPHK